MCSTGYHSSILLLDWWMGTQIFVGISHRSWGAAAEDGYFTGYITQVGQPIIWMLIYVFITAMVVLEGVHAADGEHGGIGKGQGKGNKETEKED